MSRGWHLVGMRDGRPPLPPALPSDGGDAVPSRLSDVAALVRALPPLPGLGPAMRAAPGSVPDRRSHRPPLGGAAVELLVYFRDWLLARHRSSRTIEAYLGWAARYLQHHGVDDPRRLGVDGIDDFLTALAQAGLSASTHNQARAALKCLLRDALGELGEGRPMVAPARRSQREPTVLTRAEVMAVLRAVPEHLVLPVALLYSSGLRLLECLQLRVKDVDLAYRAITVRGGKGDKDRVTPLADSLVGAMERHLAERKVAWERDLSRGIEGSTLSGGLRRKFPGAGRSWPWQYVFVAKRALTDEEGRRCRHHLHESVLQRAVPQAAAVAGVDKRVTCHTFRHSFATHLLEDRYDIRRVQELLGHEDVRTTMRYTHVMQRGGLGVRSPLDGAVEAERGRRGGGKPGQGGKWP